MIQQAGEKIQELMQVHVFQFNISLVCVVLQYQYCGQVIERFMNHELGDIVMMDREFFTMNIQRSMWQSLMRVEI